MMRDYLEIADWLRRCNVKPWPWRVVLVAFKRTAESIRRETMPPWAYKRPIESVCSSCNTKHTDGSYDCASCSGTREAFHGN